MAENKLRGANYYTTLFIANQLTGKATGLNITRLSLDCFSQMSWVCFSVLLLMIIIHVLYIFQFIQCGDIFFFIKYKLFVKDL